jgi:uncharacterized protein YndB with AHSA1/START domain
VKYVLIVLGALVGLALLVTLIGAMMPREHTVTSEIVVRKPIDSVYATLRDFAGMPAWWKDLKVSERVAGVSGERWRQESGGFVMQLDIVSENPPLGFVTKIVEEKGAPFGGEWTYALTPSGDGTRIAVTEKGWIGPPPFRVIATVTGLHRTLDGMLTALGGRFGEVVKPVHR